MTRVRVVVADRSAAVRAVLKRLLARSPAFEVVAEAEDGGQLAAAVRQHGPDVIVTEFLSPEPDGTESFTETMQQCQAPVVVLTSRPDTRGGGPGYWGLSGRVVEVLQKPRVPEAWNELAPTLHTLLRQVGMPTRASTAGMRRVTDPPSGRRLSYVAIGGSTGGPGAVVRLLREFGADLRVGVAVVQHIADGFEHSFADWIRHELGVNVRVAETGDALEPGTIRVAPVGSHLLIDGNGILRLDRETPPRRGHRPSADVLFRSFLSVGAERVAAVLLSGMGDDGVDGMRALREAGSLTLAQDESSSAVYGMPKAALDSGAAEISLSPADIGKLLARLTGGGAG